MWTGEAGCRGLWLAGVEPSPSLSVFLPHHSVDPPHSFCSCSVAVSTSPLGPFLCFLKGTWSFRSRCGTPRSPSSPLLAFPPAGQGNTLSRSPEQRLVTVSTAPFCLVGGDFCPMSHPHPPLKGGLERGYWCFPVHRLLWGPLNLCCRPFHPGGHSFRAWPSGGPHPASLLGLLFCGPVNPFPQEWKGSLAPFSVSRVQAKGAEGPSFAGGGRCISSKLWGRRQSPSGRSHSGCHLAGAVLLSFLPWGVLCGLWTGRLWGMSLSGGRVTSP